ncbi:Fe-S-cluster-containing dehydrogenase component [Roseiarcus fermentans]|uniref:Fe-S-cluster-containing dehydrogenase component n=1 Tax=Roseiarcus fermentans TaxID=1473586 RepID=A0A366EKF9_9HYPH|nr:4Fe-4S dicluster domain-containing protein [Roseiarcus fermentans]RBP02873.1 Fe-S-cluster-containing dehydrogenase component [Roseiarcus fermentans]
MTQSTPRPTARWNLIVDVALCENCNNCILATKDEYVGADFPGYSAGHARHGRSVIEITRHMRGSGHMVDVTYVPRLCNHCDDAPCIKAAPDAVRKRDDGIVVIDPVAAKGRKDLVGACPYGAIVWNEEAQLPQNWTFDAHLLDQGWTEPRCAHSCPTGVFTSVKADDAEMTRRVDAERLETIRPELKTRPRVWYKNLGRAKSHFVGGAVIGKVQGVTECIEGAEVALIADGQTLATARTDAFGDFKFDGLTRTTGDYTVRITREGFPPATAKAKAGVPTYLGELSLGG